MRLLNHIYLTPTTLYCLKITFFNRNKKVKIKERIQSMLIRLIGVLFSNGAMLSVSDKYDSVNARTQEISESIKLHILGVWQNGRKIYQATG